MSKIIVIELNIGVLFDGLKSGPVEIRFDAKHGLLEGAFILGTCCSADLLASASITFFLPNSAAPPMRDGTFFSVTAARAGQELGINVSAGNLHYIGCFEPFGIYLLRQIQ